MDALTLELIKKEGWTVIRQDGQPKIQAYGRLFPLTHPIAIHFKLYREETNPDRKYEHMKAAHDYLWPDTVWHSWTEDRFREHCRGWNYVTYAGGASTTKSYDSAKIALLFWLANPAKRAVIVASTTLESLNSRIWGYVTTLINEIKVELPFKYFRGAPPKILFNRNDTIHGMFAVAAKRGQDTDAISSWIGRHPKEGILIVLDEATDMPEALLKALPNLESGVEFFQCMAVGNSLSKFDLHGAMSTPKLGWTSVDPLRDIKWETTQKNGVCLFFSCYNSPAIYERDAIKKQKLSKFLITKEQIEEKEKLYGKDSDSFWRFVLGFWRTSSSDDTVISREFIDDFKVFERTEWSGLHPLVVVAGLDPAFSTGGDNCVLRLAYLGQNTDGQIVLDYRGDELLFKIKIVADSTKSADLQIADGVIEVLRKFNCPLRNMCVDANGQGRAIAEVIRLRSGEHTPPLKIYSTRAGNTQVNSFDVIIKTYHEVWFSFRDFIQNRQIKGLDHTTILQLTSRLVLKDEKTFKPKLEPKNVYKTRMGAIMPSLAHSPDEADAAALALQSAMLNFGFTPGQRKDLIKTESYVLQKVAAFKQAHGIGGFGEVKNRVDPPVATFEASLEDWKPPFS